MATKTIGQLDEIASLAPGDMLEVEQLATGLSKRISRTNLLGGNITGGGTIATGGNNLTIGGPSTINGNLTGGGTLALGANTLTVAGTSTINGSLVGNISGGGTIATGGNNLTVAGPSTINGSLVGNISGGGTLATGGFTLTVGGASSINGSLVGSVTGNITGGGTLVLGGFTLTAPATGTVSLLGVAQTYSAVKTFDAGIVLGTGGPTLTNGGANTVLSGGLNLNNAGSVLVSLGAFSINDDAVYTVSGLDNGIFFLAVGSADNTLGAIVNYRCAATPHLVPFGVGSNVNLTTGVLNGVTGVDGKLTISAHTNGTLYIENRRGSARSLEAFYYG